MMHRRELLAAGATIVAGSLIGCQLQPRLTAPDGRQIFRLSQPSTARIGDVTLHTLENGLTLIHQESRGNSIVGLTALVRSGAAQVMEREAGLHNLMMRVISKGTKRRNSDQIAEELGQLGASLGTSAGYDYSRLSLQCVNEDFADAIDLFADVMLNPTFPLDQVELERRRVLAAIRMSDDQTSALTMKRFRQEVFGTHPYGRPLEGYPETVTNLQPIQLAETHQADFVPSATVLAVVGAISFDQLLPLIERHLGAVGPRREERYEVDKVIAPAGGRVEFTKDSQQGFIALGHLTCAWGHEDLPAVEVATRVLGGGMSSRLFTTLRDQQGLAYAVGASNTSYKNQGVFTAYIGTSPATIDRAEAGLWEQVRRLRDEPVTEEELQRAKNYIAGEYLRGHERNMQRAGHLAYWHVTGKGVAYDKEYLDDINRATTRDVMRVANKYFLDPTTVVLRPTSAQRNLPPIPVLE
jgi:predicted Zn-dependent peptidase